MSDHLVPRSEEQVRCCGLRETSSGAETCFEGPDPSSEAEKLIREAKALNRGGDILEGAPGPRARRWFYNAVPAPQARRRFARGVPGMEVWWAAEVFWAVGLFCFGRHGR
jgi:hypothetical protein